MLRPPFVLLSPWALLLVALPAAAQSGLTSVPGTAVRLVPPASFAPASRFPGFQNATTGATIMVTEIPGPFADVTSGMTRENLATRGMTLTSRAEVTVAGHTGLLLGLNQSAGGVPYRKWMVVFGTPSASVLVTATFREASADAESEPLRRAVLSAQWTPTAPGVVSLEGLPFRLGPTPSFAIATRVGNNVILTLGGRALPRPPGEPFVVVGAALSRVEVSDRASFARRRVQQTASAVDITPRPGAELTVAGHPGYELTATARDEDTNAPMVIYQTVVFHGGGYTLVQGLLPAAAAEGLLTELRALTRSLSFPG